ncbi:hypothetical protein BGZ65_011739 [Modicella reniformis]|uniref:Uncharacterized protein n=1 Tax=Modicella reniformis TaxID=1440133 RepID=A0A9P6J402_9FUNG|nr:hypothetical protein BGZ65_011739 [Modicella reniformis]
MNVLLSILEDIPQHMVDNKLEDETRNETGSEFSLSSCGSTQSRNNPERNEGVSLISTSLTLRATYVLSLCPQKRDHYNLFATKPATTAKQQGDLSNKRTPSSTEPSSPVKARKSVRFDESKNTVFAYELGSAIVLSFTNDEITCSENTQDYEDQNDTGYEDEPSVNFMSPPPWWTWSSVATLDEASESTPSDPEATVDPDLSDIGVDTSSAETTIEEGSFSYSESSQSSQHETFKNIASSLDRLWPPSQSQASSGVPIAKRTKPVLPVVTSSSPLAVTSSPHKVPVLRRQSSMSVIESVDASEISSLETPEHPSALARCRGSLIKECTTENNAMPQNQVESEDISMLEPPLDSLPQRVQVPLMSRPGTPAVGEKRNVKGVIRSREREASGRTLAHPYKRRTQTAPIPSSSSPSPFTPRLARVSSFSVRRTPPTPPMLRREASTTALMDTLS